MRIESHIIPDQHRPLIEEATRRVCQARGSSMPVCQDAIADAVRSAFASGTNHMFGLVRAGTKARG